MLNSQQQQAVDTVNGQLIMIACPGSGKTTTLLHRLCNMTSAHQISPEHILMITFTKAAAKEMEERYKKLDGAKKGVTFCTIHSLCLAIIRKFGDKPVKVLPEQEAKDIFFEITKALKVEDRAQFVADLMLDISVRKNNPGKEFPLRSTNNRELFGQISDKYEEYKSDHGLIDFDDILTYAYDILCSNSASLEFIRGKYRYIQVDEYQDTNYIQRDIIYLIAGENGNLAVVGDDDQSIYGFRGAAPGIMLDFKKDYPDARVVHMGTNYRSCKDIVDVAGNMILRNSTRFAKEFTAARTEHGTVERMSFSDRNAEIVSVADRLKQMSESGIRPESISVIYRTNSQAEAVVSELVKRHVPFCLNDAVTCRYEHWIFKDILAFWRMANGRGDKADFERTVNRPQRWLHAVPLPDITPDGHILITDENKKEFRLQAYHGNKEMWKMKRQAENADRYMDLLTALHDKSPERFLFLLRPIYFRYLTEYAEFRNADPGELKEIWSDLESDAAGRSWEEWIAFSRQYIHLIRQARENREGTVLTTMHRAKGLEWEHVFLIDCVDGICPFYNEKNRADIEEERRLFYVAVTRAKDHLVLCSYSRKNAKPVAASRFLSEMQNPPADESDS